ncbi:hypothetical protein OHA25_31930 [Nonomuraea sp. NBC_00507]|uniref:hypothetical protein n=1 Tax=Nonomuraea sp. NBC_00507 TaxID=2976002 RepID=UPI002E197C33
MMTTDSTVRAEFIAGLRSLARFLADNPRVPVPSNGATLTVHVVDDSDDKERATVDRVAELIGSAASGGAHYKTTRDFGPITYEALAISQECMDAWQALVSYNGAVSGGGC